MCEVYHNPYLAKLYDKELCYKYAGDVWNKVSLRDTSRLPNVDSQHDVPTPTQDVRSAEPGDFEQKGYCTRWVEVKYLAEGNHIAVPTGSNLNNNNGVNP